ncbi:Lysophospholipase L1 [Blastococcus aggregatus]|uniref:Lysophospholipase L1 n=1 Tax=Blastococcus aggregatus TaxID=38502 RepID=A0A285V6Q8_9ACTN|nr:SGNH/GDSL hydrolase family protein [Blastococcus aggregatus]SOC49703.1 Lysophospholipase L1 [Blastococcus aggregatus]
MRRLAACLSVLFAALVLIAPPAAAGGPVRYVALGDSYSAASGVLPPDLTAPPQCLRSTANYPHVIAAATGAQLTDVTCGGADTGDYLTGQYPGVAPQLDAVTADTQVVTMTIGGNDSGVFIDSIIRCGIAGASTLGTGSPCKDQYGSSFQDTITTTTYPALVQVLKAVRAKAPRAEIAILGYPSILPASGGCFAQMPVATGDVPYLRGVQATLNDAIERAAKVAGVTYVDMTRVSEGHDACQPIGVRWIEPVLLGTNPVVVHPNALGEAQMAAQAMQALRRL